MNKKKAIYKKTWADFREAGLLWWINRILHTFGWVIVVEVESTTGEITDCYPARTCFRGFTEEDEDEGFNAVTTHLAEIVSDLVQEVYDD